MKQIVIDTEFKDVIKKCSEGMSVKHSFLVRTNDNNKDKFIRLIEKYPPKLIIIDDKVQRDDMFVTLLY